MTARQILKTVKDQKAFTLIELLVVIGILAILLAITLIAINPAKQFNAANDTKRRSDINEILNAIDQYAVDNHGTLPSGISTTAADIGNGAGQVDLCGLVTTYIAAMPSDPQNGSPAGSAPCTAGATYDTKYQVSKGASDNRVTVTATASDGSTISVTR